jgi:P4 family phage/plasmid primase-like protien
MTIFNERHTDVGNARWFVRLYGDQVRWIHERGRWIVHSDTYWAEDVDGEVERMAKNAIDATLADFGDVPQNDRAGLFKHVLRSEQAPRIAAMLTLARSEPGITLAEAMLDRDSMLLGVQGGAIDLRSGAFVVPNAADYITRQAGCAYNPHAKAPLWSAFLDRIMNGDIAMIAFLQRAVGYSLTGSTKEQCLFITHGFGANGKSKFLGALSGLLGDYARECPAEALLAKHDNAIPNDIARLAGARLATSIETEEGRRFAESRVKALTGGDRITARFLHHEFFDFVPKFKLWLATNHKPTIRGTDNAIWRRIRLIPFNVTIPDAEQDCDLGDKLAAERSGILNWAIQGALAWQRDGLQIGMDFGSSAPAVVYLCAVSPGATGPDGRWYPRNSLVLVDELSTHQPNDLSKGLGWTVPVLAEEIIAMCERWAVKPRGCCDDACFAKTGSGAGSIAEEFQRCGVYFYPAKKADRISGWNIMRRLLQDAGKPDLPGLYIARHCTYFWLTAPTIGRDLRRVEDVDARSLVDHGVDSVRYTCLHQTRRVEQRDMW